MKVKTPLLLLACFTILHHASAQTALFPTPQSLKVDKGAFFITHQTEVRGSTGYANRLAERLKTELQSLTIIDARKGVILLDLKQTDGETKEASYDLQVKEDTIRLVASSESGLHHGKEALMQLVRFGKGKVNSCRIQDAPRYQWRGFMLDESRHFFGKEKVKQYFDIMASLRLNVFHWHLTDESGWRIEIKKYPKLTQEAAVGNWHDPKAAPAFYTQEEIKEVVAYAAERHIMIVPEFDMPGHATAVCRAYPEFSGGGEGRWQHFTFHPCRENTYQFISDVLDEIVQMFPSPYIHIGGDEVHYGNQSWFTDPEIQQFIQDKKLVDEKGLEHYFIRRAADIVASKGKTIIGWDEIVDAGIAPSKAVVMWWRHDKRDQLSKALKAGYRVILTPRRPMYADFIQFGSHRVGRQWSGYNVIENIYQFPEPILHLTKGYEKQVMGMQMSLWTERVADEKRLDFMTFPRLVALAEAAWTVETRKECSLFMQRLPYFLRYLDSLGIYYFNPLNPQERAEPGAPEKEDVLQNG